MNSYSKGDRVALAVRYGRRKPGAAGTVTNPAGCGAARCDCVEVRFDDAKDLEVYGLNVGVAALTSA